MLGEWMSNKAEYLEFYRESVAQTRSDAVDKLREAYEDVKAEHDLMVLAGESTEKEMPSFAEFVVGSCNLTLEEDVHDWLTFTRYAHSICPHRLHSFSVVISALHDITAEYLYDLAGDSEIEKNPFDDIVAKDKQETYLSLDMLKIKH
jgi:hypothetical protein